MARVRFPNRITVYFGEQSKLTKKGFEHICDKNHVKPTKKVANVLFYLKKKEIAPFGEMRTELFV